MELVVRWTKMGPEFTYSVWYAKQPEGPFLRDNDIRLTDDVINLLLGLDPEATYDDREDNLYYIKGLNSSDEYFVKVSCEDRYDSWWYSQSSYDSIEGGLSNPYSTPTQHEGNTLSFQLYIP